MWLRLATHKGKGVLGFGGEEGTNLLADLVDVCGQNGAQRAAVRGGHVAQVRKDACHVAAIWKGRSLLKIVARERPLRAALVAQDEFEILISGYPEYLRVMVETTVAPTIQLATT